MSSIQDSISDVEANFSIGYSLPGFYVNTHLVKRRLSP